MAFIRSLSAVSFVVFGALLAAPALAELPPQYTVWADFGAITAEKSIPHVLGTVDAIERRPGGEYIARSGNCFVAITVVRESPAKRNGQIVVGPSRIARVVVGEKRCRR